MNGWFGSVWCVLWLKMNVDFLSLSVVRNVLCVIWLRVRIVLMFGVVVSVDSK